MTGGRIGALLLIAAMSLSTLSVADPAKPLEPLAIASEGARPPFNFLDANNELAGFEIDLARAICTRVNRSCSFVAQDWDELLPGLIAHQYDAVMAALEINDERRAQVAFSIPYVRMPAVFVVQKASSLKDASVGALVGKTIGVEEGSAGQALLQERFKGARSTVFASLEEALLDLAEGKVDAVLADKLTVTDFLKSRREGQCCRVLADAPRDIALFGDGIAIAFRKPDVALREAIDAALQSMIDDGEFARISAKYFDFPVR